MTCIFYEASSNYAHIISNIETNDDWDWAKTSGRFKMLQAAHADVKTLLNEWHREFLPNDAATMKRKYTGDRLSVELTSFVAVKAKIESLATLIVNMNFAHESVMQIGV